MLAIYEVLELHFRIPRSAEAFEGLESSISQCDNGGHCSLKFEYY